MSYFKWDRRRNKKAQELLRPALPEAAAGTWGDIGCGDGIFTELLLDWLQPGSTIYAVDQDMSAIRQLQRRIEGVSQTVHLQTVPQDFTQPLTLPLLDGMLLANSLHFVRDKRPTLTQLVGLMVPGAPVIIIEYNSGRGNRFVPYPLRAESWMELMRDVGLSQVRMVARSWSSFMEEMVTMVGVRAES